MIKPSTVRQVMYERLEEGLATKLTQENKGYQLMLKMGYREGMLVGKKRDTDDSDKPLNGLKVPLMPELKPNKHGIDY